MTGKTRTPVSSNAGWPPRLGRQVAYEEAARVGDRRRRRRTSRGRWLRRSVFIFSQESLPTAHVLAYAQHSRTAITNGPFLTPSGFFWYHRRHPILHRTTACLLLRAKARRSLAFGVILAYPPSLFLSLAQRYSGAAPGDTHICIHSRFRRGARSLPSRPSHSFILSSDNTNFPWGAQG